MGMFSSKGTGEALRAAGALSTVGLAAGVLNVYRIVSQAYPKQPGPPATPVDPRGPRARANGDGTGPDDREFHDDA